MNLGEITALFSQYVDDPQHDRWDSVDARGLINEAQREAVKIITQADEGFFWAFTDLNVPAASANTCRFTLPMDFMKVITVERYTPNTLPVPGQPVTFPGRHYEPRRSFLAAGPRYTLQGKELLVVADGSAYTLRLYYTRMLPDLDTDNDVSEVPLEHHGFLAMHAAKLAHGIEKRDFSYLQEEHSRLMAEMVTMIDDRKRQEPRRVRRVYH